MALTRRYSSSRILPESFISSRPCLRACNKLASSSSEITCPPCDHNSRRSARSFSGGFCRTEDASEDVADKDVGGRDDFDEAGSGGCCGDEEAGGTRRFEVAGGILIVAFDLGCAIESGTLRASCDSLGSFWVDTVATVFSTSCSPELCAWGLFFSSFLCLSCGCGGSRSRSVDFATSSRWNVSS